MAIIAATSNANDVEYDHTGMIDDDTLPAHDPSL
jgi:hypothetical protein